jgi:predicted GNAT superfamily acetyltransferase
MTITIRSVTELENYHHFQELQRRVWGSPPIDIMPIHVTVAAIESGGGLICAFSDDGPAEMNGMVGGTFWWLGAGEHPDDPRGSAPRLRAFSHMAGVLPGWQSHGIGARLKLAQREAVLAQGVADWMTWTYDPLYRRNAVFNIRRLGATACTFERDIYGELPDALNAGWPSDRVIADWRLNSPDILQDAASPRPPIAWDLRELHMPAVAVNEDGDPLPPERDLAFDGSVIALPLPSDMDVIRKRDQALGMDWRLYMRHELETAFAAGYTIVDCVQLAGDDWRYILSHNR